MKPLSLVIKPPFGSWNLVHGFAPQPSTDPLHLDVRYRCSGPGVVRAAATGTLTVRRSFAYRVQEPEPIDTTSPAADSGDTIDLFLEIDAAATLNSLYWTKLVSNGIICGFLYRDILTSSLETSLAELLDCATLPAAGSRQDIVNLLLRGDLGIQVTTGHTIGTASPANVATPLSNPHEFAFAVHNDAGAVDPAAFYDDMREFVDDAQSDIDDFITLTPKNWPLIPDNASLANAIVAASVTVFPYSTLTRYRNASQLTNQQFRSLGEAQKYLYWQQLHYRFSTRIANSAQPPFEFNDDDAANIFQLEAVVEFFLNFTDPLLPGAIPRKPSLGTITGTNATALGFWVTLNDADVVDFAQIVANEHFVYLPGSTTKTSRSFRIVDIDPTNKAVRLHQAPNLGTAASSWVVDLYKKVDFLDPYGSVTAVNGAVVSLAGAPNLRDVVPDHDFISLTLADGSLQHLMITAVDPVAMTVTTDSAAPSSATAWTIALSPKLVLIDPFGARPVLDSLYRRDIDYRASVDATDATKVVLGQTNTSNAYPDLRGVNTRKYDSIYLESDAARPQKVYRIVGIEAQTIGSLSVRNVVQLDGSPDFGTAGLSHWQIPAGVGGKVDNLAGFSLGPDAQTATTFTYGRDQYDGQLFIIHRGEILTSWRWGSLTSRHALDVGPVTYTSSMRGNKEFDYYSVKSPGGDSGARFRNFAFNVVDRYEANNTNYIGVGEARYYFNNPVTSDSVAPGGLPGAAGKTSCLLHRGSLASANGSGSGGCLVSPNYYHLLHTLVQIEIDRRELTAQTASTALTALLNNSTTIEGPKGQYDIVASGDWDRELVGAIWLIRPEELPLNFVPSQ